jgi:hypothetical protein
MAWHEKYEFVDDPYKIIDPPTIEFERIEWNRDDLKDERIKIDNFLEDIKNSYRVGMLAYGPVGSGKTWLSRVIEKEILEIVDNAVIIRTKIPRVQPNFSSIYELFISSLIDEDTRFLDELKKKLGLNKEDWVNFMRNKDLGRCLWHIATGDKEELALSWLHGESPSATDLKNLGVYTKLTSDFKKAEVMKTLIDKTSTLFPTTILIVDELENASPAFARQLADILRDFLDEFNEKFALFCSLTASTIEEFFDFGYSDALFSRLNYHISLGLVKEEYAIEFITKVNQKYRKKGVELKNPLSPFKEDGIAKLFKIMNPEKLYPRWIFINCGTLAREAEKENKEIDTKFVLEHKGRLTHILPTIQKKLA